MDTVAHPIARRTRTHRTAVEAAALVAEWRASGLNKQSFARQSGVLRSTLNSCLKRVDQGASAPAGFVEVRPARIQSTGDLTLELGELRVIGLDVGTAAALVVALRSVAR